VKRATCALLLSLFAVASAAQTVSIALVGDILLDDGPGRLIKRGGNPFAAFAPLLDTADIRVGNLECVIATTGSPEPGKIWTFRAHPRTLSLLKRHFDALSLANNHSGDYGPEAFSEMLGLLKRQGIPYFGGGHNLSEAHTPLLIERKGLRIAFLGYNEFFPRSFEADADKPGIAWSEDEQVRRDIAEARQRYHADLVIPFMHWGWENERQAGARQRSLAKIMIDAGADAVVGTHPHVTQDIELYRGKPIIYSLGNFVFDGFDEVANNTGWLLRIEVDKEGVLNWRTHIATIDQRGVPRPATEEGKCWQRGDDSPRDCSALR